MEHFLDAYIKLVTAFLTFVAPLTTLLLSELKEHKRRKVARLKEIENEAVNRLTGDVPGSSFTKLVKDTAKQINEEEQSIESEINLLTPQKTIPKIFISLGFAVFLGMSCWLIIDNVWGMYSQLTLRIVFALSVTSFAYCLNLLVKVVRLVMLSKESND